MSCAFEPDVFEGEGEHFVLGGDGPTERQQNDVDQQQAVQQVRGERGFDGVERDVIPVVGVGVHRERAVDHVEHAPAVVGARAVVDDEREQYPLDDGRDRERGVRVGERDGPAAVVGERGRALPTAFAGEEPRAGRAERVPHGVPAAQQHAHLAQRQVVVHVAVAQQEHVATAAAQGVAARVHEQSRVAEPVQALYEHDERDERRPVNVPAERPRAVRVEHLVETAPRHQFRVDDEIVHDKMIGARLTPGSSV